MFFRGAIRHGDGIEAQLIGELRGRQELGVPGAVGLLRVARVMPKPKEFCGRADSVMPSPRGGEWVVPHRAGQGVSKSPEDAGNYQRVRPRVALDCGHERDAKRPGVYRGTVGASFPVCRAVRRAVPLGRGSGAVRGGGDPGAVDRGARAHRQRDGLLLLNRFVMSPEGPLLLQYWRSYDALDTWARTQPHSSWWRWLLDNAGENLGFYHEIYQARTAEAIYEHGTQPVGPAQFCTTEVVPARRRSLPPAATAIPWTPP